MIINKHNLITTGSEGNGFHGVCEHCEVALVTDLGYCSWDGLKCIDRYITLYLDIPNEIRSYAKFRNLIWDNINKIFTRPFTYETYTIDELNNHIMKLTA